jgi:anti-sigma factor NepR-like protein
MTDQNIAGPEGLPVDRLHEPGLDPAAYVLATHGSPTVQEKSVERLRRMYEQFAGQPVPERLLSLFSGKV